MAAVNVTFPGNLAQVRTAAELRSIPSSLLPLGALFLVNELEGLFEYDPGSTAADDSINTLRPVDKAPGQAGRWIKSATGLAAGPRGPQGEGLADVMAPGGAALVGFNQPLGKARSLQSKSRDTVSVKDFGAIGDGFEHPLADFYPSLAAAKVDFPAATSLANLIDGLAIQKAIDAVESTIGTFGGDPAGRGSVYIPAGRYRGNTGSIKVPNFMEVRGDGPDRTIIDNQNTVATWPLFVNKNPTNLFTVSLRDMSAHGGTMAFKNTITSEVNGLIMERFYCRLQTQKNVEFNRLLQLSRFSYCVFGDAPIGFDVLDYTTNAVDFHTCSWENHVEQSLRLKFAEGVNIYGGRFEGGGRPTGFATIELDNAKAFNIYGTYFERDHPLLLKETNSKNGVTFFSPHFTGASTAGDGPFLPFDVQSDGAVNWAGAPNFGERTMGAIDKAFVAGNAGDRFGKSSTQQQFANTRSRKDVLSREKAIPSNLKVNLVRFQRAGMSGAQNNFQQAAGILTVNFGGLASGGNDRCVVKRFIVRITSSGFAAIAATIAAEPTAITLGGADVSVGVQTGASSTDMMLEATFSGIDPSTWVVGNVNFHWESIAHSTNDDDFLAVTVQ